MPNLITPGRSAVCHRVLVADDQPDCVEVVCALLEWMGHVCHRASTGVDALASVRALEPDLVLLDLTLPDISGLDVARAVRRDVRRQPYLVAITGWEHPEHRTRTLKAGFDAHIVKPVDLVTLDAIVSATPRSVRCNPTLAIVR